MHKEKTYIDHTTERREFREGGVRALGRGARSPVPGSVCGHVDTGYVG